MAEPFNRCGAKLAPAHNLEAMYSDRQITAHHEAGHARAAARRAGTVDGIDISFDAGRARGWTAVDVPDLDDIAFYAYAGSWAQARLRGPAACDDLDDMWFLVQQNSDDWGEIQRAHGRDITGADTFGAGLNGMQKRPYPPAGEIRPDDSQVLQWHTDLAEEWASIKVLAQQMLRGFSEITVGAGPPLVQDIANSSRWIRPGYRVPDSLNQF
jgi:hypothetical protein